ncbi:MAG: DUF1800 domain-containing protein [Acidobacteria bacterium]|jgi:uncharacterized protein (DUF1800 family)|nr:DUF1800 domain-containing protein [Acidobacteriota bacterium]
MQTSQWQLLEHLIRRAGFGATPEERNSFEELTYRQAVASLLNFGPTSRDIDARIGTPGYLGFTSRNGFTPNTVIADARQRWIFRMVHSPAPLREKMALLWHHHFATAYSKLAGSFGAVEGTRLMAAKPSEDTAGVRGQIELFREQGLGKFSDLLVEVARDPAMIVWLDGNTNIKSRPQENFGRELMELFTFGIGNYTEEDVYAAARVFTGWNLTLLGTRNTPSARYAFNYRSAQHDTAAKTFTFPIYSSGSKVIPARAATTGMQDGLDLIAALAVHPETARRLSRRLWTWFVSEVSPPDEAWVEKIAGVYLSSGTDMRQVLREVLLSAQFRDPAHYFQRYAWPVEFVVRSLKEVGHVGFSANDALTPMLNMGQSLFEPPDVNGWALGPQWFSTGGMLARMNFVSALATNQRFELRNAARPFRQTPQAVIEWAMRKTTMPEVPAHVYNALVDYTRAGGNWTGSETQLLNKAAGVVHLLTGSGEYQFI